ncbi:GPI mannosyltransferase 2 [Polyplosphaeria fusca]|uniref:GPI mannosyltransferase 2 n=1 Tax=Polyplosphaeria fusca TaxID=682080 RepID=A0A9P4RA77_9PLEO|nr:GPI mannosyltransferase 2 [Polyplosphaeria fusca]
MGRVKTLLLLFLAWKLVLLLAATFAPGFGYDTSGRILLAENTSRRTTLQSPSWIDRLVLKLLRWDALYMVKAAERGYVYEQEWAFSWAFNRLLRQATRFTTSYHEPLLQHYVLVGSLVANACHLASCFILFYLAKAIVNGPRSKTVPFIATVLHILSPAGLFLCAPYTEAPFSLFNMLGMLLYVQAHNSRKRVATWGFQQDALLVASGLSFAAATLFRSNGLLSGLLFIWDVAQYLPRVRDRQLTLSEVRRLMVTCLAGSLLAVGFVGPQLLAYREYCTATASGPGLRPWCANTVPSIYSWVQSHYWNVGLFRYWTMSNLPLFLLAAPVLWVLCSTSVTILRSLELDVTKSRARTRGSMGSELSGASFCSHPQLALPQLVLAMMAMTSFHVQIINRLSSGYPMWYMVIAGCILDPTMMTNAKSSQRLSQQVVRGTVVYSVLQGILYASFLPPA